MYRLCFFLLGILKSSCDNIESFEKLWSSIFDKGNVNLIYFGLSLSNDGSDLFLLSDFSEFSVYVESPPFLFSVIFIFPLIVSSSLISSVISMTKILPGVPLFSLLFLICARIRISTIEVKANTQQVLAVSALTGKPLRLHRPSRVASCLPDWLPDNMADSWGKVSRLSGLPSPKQQTVLLDERKVSYVFFVNQRSLSPLLCFFNWILFLWGICNTTKTVLDTDAVKSVYVEYRF